MTYEHSTPGTLEKLRSLYRRVYVLGSHWGEYRAAWLEPVDPHRALRERVLDAGCGRGEVLHEFQNRSISIDYCGVDLAVGDSSWDFKVSAVADLHQLPFRNAVFDKVISNQVLEHVDHPHRVFQEMIRVLRPGGLLFLSLPLVWHLHQEPYDRFRFTANSVEFLADEQGVTIESITPMGGYFTVCRYLLVHFELVLEQFSIPLAKVYAKLIRFFDLTIGAPLFYMLDKLDKRRKLTLGYFVRIRKPPENRPTAEQRKDENSLFTCPYCVDNPDSSFRDNCSQWTCTSCSREYQLRNGVPVLTPSGAYQLEKAKIRRALDNS